MTSLWTLPTARTDNWLGQWLVICCKGSVHFRIDSHPSAYARLTKGDLNEVTGMENGSRLLAMLIDGDNAQASLINGVLEESAKYGTVITRRVYGDFRSSHLSQWSDCLQAYAIEPVHCVPNSTGKNATDIRLVIDAMDSLHEGVTGGFVIVSSDGDYTALATKMHDRGKFVLGAGSQTTPKAFQNACDRFFDTSVLSPETGKNKKARGTNNHPKWVKQAVEAIEGVQQDDGWATLSAVGVHLRKTDPSWDPRKFEGGKHKQLTPLLKSKTAVFEVKGKGASGRVRLAGK